MDQATTSSGEQTAETMKVIVRDRAAEHGRFTQPITRTCEISARCPKCGGRRGEPFNIPSHDDGAWYTVQGWHNPCGHKDRYAEVIAEAKARGTLGGPVPN